MKTHPEITDFKFRYVRNGVTTGLGSTKGSLGDKALVLGEDSIPYENIADTATRGNRMVMVLRDFRASGKLAKNLVEGGAVVLEPGKPGARLLEMAIDRKSAQIEAKRRRAELIANGQEHLLRSEQCPVCSAIIDLSGLEATPYIYCRFCESLFSKDRSRITNGERYRICDECGMFDRVQDYPEFYFYFLLVVYGFSYKQRFLCDACAHSLFLKALALNFVFLLGLPTALWVKIKSLKGRDSKFAVLARANSRARAGKYREASVDYAAVLRQEPNHPAILMNEALGYVMAGDQKQAAWLLEKSLSACNHYIPVLRLIQPHAEG